MKLSWTQIAGILLPLATAGIAIVSGKVEDRKLKEEVAEQVAKALSKENK